MRSGRITTRTHTVAQAYARVLRASRASGRVYLGKGAPHSTKKSRRASGQLSSHSQRPR
jgi:hypothetical protein